MHIVRLRDLWERWRVVGDLDERGSWSREKAFSAGSSLEFMRLKLYHIEFSILWKECIKTIAKSAEESRTFSTFILNASLKKLLPDASTFLWAWSSFECPSAVLRRILQSTKSPSLRNCWRREANVTPNSFAFSTVGVWHRTGILSSEC